MIDRLHGSLQNLREVSAPTEKLRRIRAECDGRSTLLRRLLEQRQMDTGSSNEPPFTLTVSAARLSL
jgi:hypothetical protein